MSISTHVLDAARGEPAVGVRVTLALGGDTDWLPIASKETDADGRCPGLTDGLTLEPGIYRLHFETGAYFAAGATPTFYPFVELAFTIDDPDGHYHVPLLLSPYAYSTYRGS